MKIQLPAQVQKMSDKSDSLIKEINEHGKSDKEKTVEETKDKIEIKPTVKEPENQDPPVKTETESTWEHKYKVLQGKYNKEVKQLKEAISPLKSQVRNLTLRINEGDSQLIHLQDKLAQKENVPTPKKVDVPESIMSFLTEDERSHMNEEGFDNKSMEIIGRLITKISSINTPDKTQSVDLEEIKREVKLNKQNRVAAFWNELSAKVVDWEEINSSVEFNNWLDDFIPYTTITRRDAIKSAQEQLDHKKVIEIFDGFKKSQTPKEEPQKLHINPEEHLEPTSTVGHVETTEVKPKGKIYTRQEVKDFYKDAANVAIGTSKKYTSQDIERIDADIMKANKEGRIIN